MKYFAQVNFKSDKQLYTKGEQYEFTGEQEKMLLNAEVIGKTKPVETYEEVAKALDEVVSDQKKEIAALKAKIAELEKGKKDAK